jgi:DNA-binding LacI/PurR family transcriptional regulator
VETARLLRQNGKIPRALFVTEDSLAYGLMREFRDNGTRVPEDVAMVGFGAHANFLHRDNDLTSVKQPAAEKGRAAAEILLELIDARGDRETPDTIRVLEPELVVQRSCGCTQISDNERRSTN